MIFQILPSTSYVSQSLKNYPKSQNSCERAPEIYYFPYGTSHISIYYLLQVKSKEIEQIVCNQTHFKDENIKPKEGKTFTQTYMLVSGRVWIRTQSFWLLHYVLCFTSMPSIILSPFVPAQLHNNPLLS